jgi:uncharacterized protein (TIGR00369 family)
MGTLVPQDERFEERVRASFGRQRVMELIGAELTRVDPGLVEIRLPYRDDLTQQHGFLHAGVITTVVDSACGYAALSLMPLGAGVLSIEFKVNLLAPARGRNFLARGRVLRPGRTVIVCTGELVEIGDEGEGEETLVATMLGTMMVARDRTGVTD